MPGFVAMDVFSAWPVVVFGWPAVCAALGAFAAGILTRQARWTVLGTILSAPFCLYVSGYPAIRGLGLVVIALNALGAFAVRRGRVWLGGGLVGPFVALAGWVATAVALG